MLGGGCRSILNKTWIDHNSMKPGRKPVVISLVSTWQAVLSRLHLMTSAKRWNNTKMKHMLAWVTLHGS